MLQGKKRLGRGRGGKLKRLWENPLVLPWCAQRSVIPVWPAEPWLVHHVQPQAFCPSLQGNPRVTHFSFFHPWNSHVPDTAHSQGWWLRMAAAHGQEQPLPTATPAVTALPQILVAGRSFMEKVVGFPSLHGLGAVPCDGMQQKEPFTKPGNSLFSYFIYSPQPSWMCNACQRGSGCPTRRAGQHPACNRGHLSPKTRSPGLAGVGRQPGDSPRHAGHPALLPMVSARLWREHGGLGRISRRLREDGGAEDGHAEGWQGLGLVRQHMPLSRAWHVSARPRHLQLQPSTPRSSPLKGIRAPALIGQAR